MSLHRRSSSLLRGRALGATLALGALALAAGIVQIVACGDGAATVDGMDSRVDATSGVDTGTVDRDASFVPPIPTSVPDGWDLFSDYDPGCGFYVPRSRDALPKPISWEPCTSIAGAAGVPGPAAIDCRRMVQDWAPAPNGQNTTTWFPSFVTENGDVVVLVRRLTKDVVYDVVASVDGPVHQALLQAAPETCVTALDTLGGGQVIYRVYDHAANINADHSGGALGAGLDELRPRVLLPKGHNPGALSHSLVVGRNMFVESVGPDWIYALSDGGIVDAIVNPSDEADLVYGSYRFQDDALFFEGNSQLRTIVKVWTQGQGARVLVGHGSDTSRESSGFGTDGTDMVWIESSGRVDTSTQIYPQLETWTAKYTTDADTLNAGKRRLRSEYRGSETEVNVVGCGYAAHTIYPPSTWGQRGIRILRIVDGASWELASSSPEQQAGLHFTRPVALTCDEIFVQAAVGSHAELVRITLSSLGAPTPAD